MKKTNYSALLKLIVLIVLATAPAFAGSFGVKDFLCSVHKVIGVDTTGHALITVVLLLLAIGFGFYAAYTSIKEKKVNTLFIVIALVLLVLTTTWGNLVDTISSVTGYPEFIENTDICTS